MYKIVTKYLLPAKQETQLKTLYIPSMEENTKFVTVSEQRGGFSQSILIPCEEETRWWAPWYKVDHYLKGRHV